MNKKTLFFSFLILSNISSAEYLFNFKTPILKDMIFKETQITNDPEYWTFVGVDLSNMRPAYRDDSSFSAGGADFNFGQKPFLGDTRGYKPYDINYNSSFWINGSVNQDNVVRPPNLSTTYYPVSYSSGKYYFEATIYTSVADKIGLLSNNSTNLATDSKNIYLNYIGTYNSRIFKGKNSIPWDNSYNIIHGDTVQFYIDFDNNKILIQKLNTTINDHINYILD